MTALKRLYVLLFATSLAFLEYRRFNSLTFDAKDNEAKTAVDNNRDWGTTMVLFSFRDLVAMFCQHYQCLIPHFLFTFLIPSG